MPRLSLFAALIVLAANAATVHAETSSWSSTTSAVPGGAGKEAKILKSVPIAKGALPKARLPSKAAPAQAAASTGAAVKTALGDDAAYEAFDQGRYLTALDLATKAALKGDPASHTLVGRIHAEGLGLAKNEVLAAQWYRRAAELGDVEGMFAFGVMLAEGDGIKKDRAGAGQMFELAAARGHGLANYNLALLFLKGDGKPENPRRAAAHMLFAAEQGIVVAQYDVGTLFATGSGFEDATGAGLMANAFEAAKWIGRAAAAGHSDAEVDYAVLLFQGRGVEQNEQRAVEFFRSAAAKGNVVAQNRLARCLANGAGVEKDLVEAAKWNAIAKAGGLADEAVDKLVARLSKSERAKAEKDAEEWREAAGVTVP